MILTTDEPHADGDVQEKALQAYRYYGTELDLITKHIGEIVRKLHKISGRKREFDITELGVGEQKLEPVLEGIASEGYKTANVNLVDIDQRRIDAARDYLAKRLGIPDAVFNPVNTDFTRLEQASLSRNNDAISLTTFFGTTFCNQQPNTSLDFIKTRYALLGIYHDPEDKEDRDAMVGEYETAEMREHTKHIGRDWGLTNQDLDGKCTFGAQLLSVDWSKEYGESFRNVKVIVPYFELKEAVSTDYFNFSKGDRICGIRSYKYSTEQFGEMLERHGFRVIESFPDSAKPKDGVKLYLVENTRFNG
ncbi:L-histidine N(alpha)-methyltransferase [Candidatus Woesearchaeota archaeon]|nr:L-histidine N(alpha)-methyltransferase [Candidatus Woesearchaeota archaeon]